MHLISDGLTSHVLMSHSGLLGVLHLSVLKETLSINITVLQTLHFTSRGQRFTLCLNIDIEFTDDVEMSKSKTFYSPSFKC